MAVMASLGGSQTHHHHDGGAESDSTGVRPDSLAGLGFGLCIAWTDSASAPLLPCERTPFGNFRSMHAAPVDNVSILPVAVTTTPPVRAPPSFRHAAV